MVTSQIVSIGIGSAHACAVRADGSISCRGSNAQGQSTPPPGVLFSQVVAGGQHTCAQTVDHYDQAKDGVWICWGDNTFGQATAPPGAKFDYVAAGGRHTCGFGSQGLVCWGDNSFGQSTPPSGAFTGNVYSNGIAAGRNHTCASLELLDATGQGQAGQVVCWGDNSRGQATPPADVAQTGASFLAAGGDHTCSGGFGPDDVRCWGDNSSGQSTEPPGFIRLISVASGHSCGMPFGGFRNGEILCWGSDWGDSLSAPPDGPFFQVVAGDFLNCGFPTDQTQPVVCWGQSYEPWF
jgi:alpha-tubulin suppressor-like RCC1 family protein